ncbi:TPA: hypothetical protein ACPJ0D_004786 [Vibrio diabolicus]
MENIDKFNLYTALILAELYKSFPISRTLRAEDLLEKIMTHDQIWVKNLGSEYIHLELEDKPNTYSSEFRDEAKVFRATRDWLLECKYILLLEINNTRKDTLYVLSPKGLEVLASVPNSLRTTKTYGEKFNEILSQSATDLRKSGISQLLGEVLRMTITAN